MTNVEQVNAAYEAGWLECACWAKRDDLIADIGSPAYIADREAHTDTIIANGSAAPELLDELKALRRAYVNLLESGRDRIIDLGGTCDPVDVMERNDPALRSSFAAIAKATTP